MLSVLLFPLRQRSAGNRRKHDAGCTKRVVIDTRAAASCRILFEICAMVGDPELNSFFKNNPMQSSARKLPTKSCSYSQDDHRRSAVWKPTARHFEYVPKFAVYEKDRDDDPAYGGECTARRAYIRWAWLRKYASALPAKSQTLTSLTLARGEARTTKIPGVGPNVPIKSWLLPPTVRWTLALNAVRLSMGTPSRTAMRANA